MTTPYGAQGWELPAEPPQHPMQPQSPHYPMQAQPPHYPMQGQPPQYATPAPPAQPHPGSRPASGGIRLAAHLLDSLIAGIVIGIIGVVAIKLIDFILWKVLDALDPDFLYYGTGTDWMTVAIILNLIQLSLLQVLAMVPYYLYKSFAEARWGCNLGKRLVNLRVATVTGEPMSYRVAARRNRWFLVGAIPLIGGFITPFMALAIFIQSSGGNRAFNDRTAGAVVLAR